MQQEHVLKQTLSDLATASRILAHHGIVDGFGHISVRDPSNPQSQFLLSRNLAPALVTPHDIVTYKIPDAEPVGALPPSGFIERHIHAQLYARYGEDVQAVVHFHAPEIIPFGLVPSEKLPFLPVFHMAAFLGVESPPIFDIAGPYGSMTDLLIRTDNHGRSLAAYFNNPFSNNARPFVLMRGHGATLVAPSIRLAVYRAIYTVINARVLTSTRALLPPEDVDGIKYLSEGECEAAAAVIAGQVDRAWGLWAKEVGQQ